MNNSCCVVGYTHIHTAPSLSHNEHPVTQPAPRALPHQLILSSFKREKRRKKNKKKHPPIPSIRFMQTRKTCVITLPLGYVCIIRAQWLGCTTASLPVCALLRPLPSLSITHWPSRSTLWAERRAWQGPSRKVKARLTSFSKKVIGVFWSPYLDVSVCLENCSVLKKKMGRPIFLACLCVSVCSGRIMFNYVLLPLWADD